jgi:hypothetical protein
MKRYVLLAGIGITAVALALSLATADEHGQTTVMLTEVAVASGNIANGEEIPLPLYADGTQATEDECHWIVGINHLESSYNGDLFQEIECFTGTPTPRTVTVRLRNETSSFFPGVANYMIIATRTGLPVAVSPTSWSGVKSISR